MFLDEARIASGMTHPNICSVFDFGEHDGVYYLVMEYLAGRSLFQVFDQVRSRPEATSNPLFYPLVAQIVAQACEGLHAVHMMTDSRGRQRNVVHRDVSPENIFVTFDGSVQLMDFGIAHATQRARDSDPGTFKGKMAYASPEQFGEDPVDARADVWAAGVVLWELLTGSTLFHRSSDASMLNAVLTEPIAEPSNVRSEVPPTLDEIVMRALERDPEARFQTARAMAQALHQFTAQRGVHVGMAELSDWMRHLFPEGLERSHSLVSEAKGIDSGVLRGAVLLDKALNEQMSQEILMPEHRGDHRPSVWNSTTDISVSSPDEEPLSSKATVIQGKSKHGRLERNAGAAWADAGPTVVDEGIEGEMARAQDATRWAEPEETRKETEGKEGEDREPLFTPLTFFLLFVLIVTAVFVYLQVTYLEKTRTNFSAGDVLKTVD
jgi:serine/threonine protein kinase